MHSATTKIILKLLVIIAPSLPAAAVQGDASAAALQTFRTAHDQYHAAPQNSTNAWQFARTCFDLADFSTNNSERAAIAQQGIAAARQAIALASNSAPAHYYLGLNQGQLARTKSLGALPLVSQMEREFLAAANLDAQFDYAGPDRSLGLLYRDAPAFGSIGSRTKSRQHLQRAAQLDPDYPENQLNLVESNLKWNDRNTARRELGKLEAIWKPAHEKFAGQAWATNWIDWEARYQSAKKILDEPPKPIETPRH